MPKLLLVDANNLAARCDYVMQNLTNPQGQRTGAIFGVLKSLVSYIDNFSPDRIIMAWDGGHSFWRDELFPEYKASRASARSVDPEAQESYKQYIRQLEVIRELLGHHPVISLFQPRMEADDILAFCAADEFYGSWDKILISSDEDFFQLLEIPRLSVWSPAKETMITPGWVEEHYGVSPGEHLILKCFVGDGSDEIPGFPQVGPATAKKIIREIGGAPPDSLKLSRYMSSEALDFYSKTARMKNITAETIGDLKRNYALMNLFFGIKCMRDRTPEVCSGFQERFKSVPSFNRATVYQALIKADMRSYVSNFSSYERNWMKLVS